MQAYPESRAHASRPPAGRRASARLLTARELGAWRGFLKTHAALVRRLDDELSRAHGLALTSYEVLLYLADAPEQRLRMSDLAASLLLSQSGVTRLVERLEREGLVRRERCEDDARGTYAVLTEAGRARFAQARPTHLAGVRRLFLDRLSREEQELLGELWRRLEP
jgi:DNA-binding MarR family transcriptional regulator